MYFRGVKAGLVDRECDVAEIDKELISARSKLNVLEQSGKDHLIVANSVRSSVLRPCCYMLAVAPEYGRAITTWA